MGNNSTPQHSISTITSAITPIIKAGSQLDDKTTKELYQDAIAYSDNSIVITENCIQHVNTMLEISDNIHQDLERQGNIISDISADCDHISDNMKHSDRKLRSIGSIWGALYNKITPSHKRNKKSKVKTIKSIAPKREIVKPVTSVTTTEFIVNANPEEKILNHNNRIIDANLDRLDSMMTTLYHSSVTMGHTIQTHNEQLDRIDPFISKINKRVDILSTKCDTITK